MRASRIDHEFLEYGECGVLVFFFDDDFELCNDIVVADSGFDIENDFCDFS